MLLTSGSGRYPLSSQGVPLPLVPVKLIDLTVQRQTIKSVPSGSMVPISHAYLLSREAVVHFLVPKSFVCPITIDSVFRKQQSRKRGRTGSWEVFLFLTPSTGKKKGVIFRRPRVLLGWKESTAIHIIEAESLACLRGSFKQCEA